MPYKDKEKHRACVRSWNKRNKDGMKKASRKHYWNNREKRLAQTMQCYYKRNGWTLEKFNEVLLEQNNKCAICKCEVITNVRVSKSRACADHEHCVPPKPRGILCASCNMALGMFQDDSEILANAISYLEKYKNIGDN